MKAHGLHIVALGLLVVSTIMFWTGNALALPTIIDFDSLTHGEIVTNQFAGLTISAVNYTGPDAAIIFDSRERGTRDPDLEGPNRSNGSWARGNLASDTILGNLLIIAENVKDRNGDGYVDHPNDEGSRPAGAFSFDFGDSLLSSFGFDIVDVEGNAEKFSVSFYNGGSEIASLGFDDFQDRDGAIFGDNSANRISAITSVDFESIDFLFDRVDISMGGSGGIDNIVFETYMPLPTVPEPATMLLMGAGLFGIIAIARKHRV